MSNIHMHVRGSAMIPLPKTPKEIKEKFLDNNPKYKEIKDNNVSTGDFHTINEDDEVWLMQCPKGTDLSALKEQKIKFPGRCNQNEYETVAVEYPQPVSHAFGHKNRKGHNSIKILPIQGSVILRKRLKAVTPPEEVQAEAPPGRVPMPNDIKQRHPLHGIDYESKLKIDPEVAERLKRADQVPIRSSSTAKSKSKKKTKQPTTIPVDSDGDVELVTQKKPKKKKRKHSSNEEAVVSDSSKKRKKNKNNGLSDDVAEDLQWIQKL